MWPHLAGGLLGTILLTSIFRVAAEAGVTRMDFALILGTMFTQERRKARAIGYGVHLAIGLLFAVVYGALFEAIGWSTWWLGALFGALHALWLATIGVSVLLPMIHPLMGTPETAADEVALIEPPGLMMTNYGRRTFLVALAAHAAFGAVIGWAAQI